MKYSNDAIEVVGAGPSGLAAAIVLAKGGKKVVVHEAKKEVGARFQGDFQGLENWTDNDNILDLLEEHGIKPSFNYQVCKGGMAYDAFGKEYSVKSSQPLFYMVERGPGQGTLDTSLYEQAVALGVEVKFQSKVTSFKNQGILACGPKAADAIATGYHFKTDLQDGFWVICDDELAPKGYSYLLTMNGRGTIKSCMFADFKNWKKYVAKTVKRFEQITGVLMIDPVLHGGSGNFYYPESAYTGDHPMAGEQAGFQDALFGFGMKYAIFSGIFAARSLLENSNYDVLWRRNLGKNMKVAILNRVIFDRLGNKGYAKLIAKLTKTQDSRGLLQKQYRSNWIKAIGYQLVKGRYSSRRAKYGCHESGCDCIWCRCQHDV